MRIADVLSAAWVAKGCGDGCVPLAPRRWVRALNHSRFRLKRPGCKAKSPRAVSIIACSSDSSRPVPTVTPAKGIAGHFRATFARRSRLPTSPAPAVGRRQPNLYPACPYNFSRACGGPTPRPKFQIFPPSRFGAVPRFGAVRGGRGDAAKALQPGEGVTFHPACPHLQVREASRHKLRQPFHAESLASEMAH